MSSNKPTPVVLTIAGSDCSGGAGIQADIKAGAVFAVHMATVITALTAQNSASLTAVFPVTVHQLMAQIDAVNSSFPIAAVKLGMLGSTEILQAVAQWLTTITVPVVIDPVFGATSGGSLCLDGDVAQLYREHLLPLATVITPNLSEAARLLGVPEAVSYEDMVEQANALQMLGSGAVLLKGGHANLRLATDVLVADEVYPFSAPKIATTHTHGGGCTLATAIAAGLAQGLSVKQAVAAAKTFIQGAIHNSERLQLAPVNGPVHAFYQYW